MNGVYRPGKTLPCSAVLYISVLLLSLASEAASAPEANAMRTQPNIVLLFADDLGYGSVSSYGSDIPTPHIDSIAVNGVRFTSGYMTAPVCNPSRNGLMTGRYQQRWGKELNSQTVPPVGATRGTLGTQHTTIANALKEVGYTNGAVGKWQLGMVPRLHPLDRGFDYFVGMSAGMDYLDPTWPGAHYMAMYRSKSRKEVSGQKGAGENPNRPYGLFRGREQIPLTEYLTTQLAREGVEFIGRNSDRPFFLYLAFNAPHSPMQVTDEFYQRFPHLNDESRRIYAGMVSALDDGVGMVLDKLRAEGLEESTLVIFTSDNGAVATFDTDRVHNRPLIGHKRNLYEGGTRVPFIMQWKDHLGAGLEYAAPVSSLDIFPTVLAVAGERDDDQYKLDGTNLMPYLEAPEGQGTPHDYLFWRSGPNAAVRHGPWTLLLTERLVRLYNVEIDPGETTNLAPSEGATVAQMRLALDDWSKEMEARRQSPARRRTTTNYNGDAIEWHI